MGLFGTNNAVTWFVSNTQSWQWQMKDEKSREMATQREANSKTSFQNSLNATSQEIRNQYNSMCNNETLAGAIVLAAQSHGVHDYDELESSAVINRFLDKNKWKGYENYVNDCLAWKITLWDAVSKMKLDKVPSVSSSNSTNKHRMNPLTTDVQFGSSQQSSNVLRGAALPTIATATVGTLAEWTYYWSKAANKVGKKWMESLYKPTDEQKSYRQYLNAKVIQASDKVKTAEKNLDAVEKEYNAAKKNGSLTDELVSWLENAKKELQQAEEALNKAKSNQKSMRTLADTAYDYGIWNIFNGSVLNSKWGDLALARANEIFDDVINPILKDSDITINVMDRVEELKDLIPSMTSDPWRQQDLLEAWGVLLDEYRKKGFDNYPLKDVQKLKSDLQRRVPEKYWDGKNISSAYSEMKAELSRLIREDLMKELDNATKEWNVPNLEWTRYAGKDAATLYRDWANLDEISDRALKYKVPSVEVPCVWKMEWDILNPTQKTISYSLRKIWDYIENSKFGKAMSKINKTLGKLFKNKKVLWTLTAVWTIWSFVDALEITKWADFFTKYADDLMKITNRYNKSGEFEGKTDEEIEKMFPESEVLSILKAIDEDKDVAPFFEYFNEDLFWRKKVDMNDYWDYVGWKLKNDELKYPWEQWWEINSISMWE